MKRHQIYLNLENYIKFIKLDVAEFYPSITLQLLEKCLKWAENYTAISELEKVIIINARKTFLFYKGEAWVKKCDNNTNFDVPQGCLDGAEVSELVGLYMLNILSQKLDKELFGIYRDDFLTGFPTRPPDRPGLMGFATHHPDRPGLTDFSDPPPGPAQASPK